MLPKIKVERTELIFLGTAVAKYKFLNEHLILLNNIIDEKLKNRSLKKYGNSLAGELENEYDLFSDLTQPILGAFESYILDFFKRLDLSIKKYEMISCWFNEQKQNEYNPLHVHRGLSSNSTGISSVLYLKIPECIKQAKSKNKQEVPKDGRLEFIKESPSFLSKTNHIVHPEVGDFYLFPYTLHHCVYPFKGEGIRRSLSFNVEVI